VKLEEEKNVIFTFKVLGETSSYFESTANSSYATTSYFHFGLKKKCMWISISSSKNFKLEISF